MGGHLVMAGKGILYDQATSNFISDKWCGVVRFVLITIMHDT